MAKVFFDRISKRVDEVVRCTHSNQVMGRMFAQYYLLRSRYENATPNLRW